jgi:SOS response regulatory protein OraA/RecX
MYQEIKNKLQQKGFSEETASRLAEFINDAGWDSVRDVLNELSDEL